MALEGLAPPPLQFRLGTVIPASFSVLRRNILTFFVVTVVCVLPLIVVSAAVAAVFALSLAQHAEFDSGSIVAVVVLVFAVMFTFLLIQSAISFGTFQDVRGERARIGACISRAFAVLPRVFGATVIIVVVMLLIALVFMLLASIFLGSMFLGATFTGQPSVAPAIGGIVGAVAMVLLALVPIVYLWVVWWAVVPAIVVEGAGPISALGRSYRLVSGHRWAVLGLLVLLSVSNFITSQVLQHAIQAASDSVAAVLILFAVNLVVSVFFMVLSSVLPAVGYYHLRAEKEGFGIDDLARVFD